MRTIHYHRHLDAIVAMARLAARESPAQPSRALVRTGCQPVKAGISSSKNGSKMGSQPAMISISSDQNEVLNKK